VSLLRFCAHSQSFLLTVLFIRTMSSEFRMIDHLPIQRRSRLKVCTVCANIATVYLYRQSHSRRGRHGNGPKFDRDQNSSRVVSTTSAIAIRSSSRLLSWFHRSIVFLFERTSRPLIKVFLGETTTKLSKGRYLGLAVKILNLILGTKISN
jgi:hypothetical protein